MERRSQNRGRLLALGIAVIAVGVLVITGTLSKDWLIERWYIRQLDLGTQDQMLLAARHLSRRRCLDAVPAILRAMSRTSESKGRDPLALLVGPAEILPGTSPSELPEGWKELGFLQALHDMMPSARPTLIRCLHGSDQDIIPWAATVLSYSVTSPSFGDWVHQGRWVSDVRTLVPALKDLQSEDQPIEVRRAAIAALRRFEGDRVEIRPGS